MTTIGAYTFITSDWEERDYPLDLWLEHHLSIFDQVALVTYGTFPVPHADNPKLLLQSMEETRREHLPSDGPHIIWCCRPKQVAQEMLTTDWKFLMGVDEFLKQRPVPDESATAHSANIRNLFGNVNHQIIKPGSNETGFICDGRMPWNVLHRGPLQVIFDGCASINPCSGAPIDIFHTTLLRKKQNTGFGSNVVDGELFNYPNWKKFWPESSLQYLSDDELPEIFVRNKSRFHFADFG